MVDFPFYKRRKDSSAALQLFHVEPSEGALLPSTRASMSCSMRRVSSSLVFPMEGGNVDEVVDIENGMPRPRILIVDDSSANRSVW